MTVATDWNSYYKTVAPTARLTRKHTTSVLLSCIHRYGQPGCGDGLRIVEIGGANSCFLDAILTQIQPGSYDVVDTNEYGLSLLQERFGDHPTLRLHQQSVLTLPPDMRDADVVFSVGLVEHFDQSATRKAVQAHFDVLRPGGTAIITFPTPTWLYIAARRTLEGLRLWKFPDERPLWPAEVRDAVQSVGAHVLEERTMWPLILTQHLIVARKVA